LIRTTTFSPLRELYDRCGTAGFLAANATQTQADVAAARTVAA
jgi:hypothetical protein